MVTAPELARRLGLNPKTFRGWLRRQATAGHPLLSSHGHYGRWEFSEQEALALAAEYRGQSRETASRPMPSAEHADMSAQDATPPTPVAPDRAATVRLPIGRAGHRVAMEWMGETVGTLADLLRPGLHAVIVGINPAPVSVAAGHYYQGRAGQALYRRLREVGLLEDGAGFADDRAFAAGVGFTDVVKRPTASADGVTPAELAHGRELLAAKLAEMQPHLLLFAFKKAATTLLGPFEGFGFVGNQFAGADVFVMPRPWERTELAKPELDALASRVREG